MLISLFLTERETDIHDKTNPKKYAPESPKNIFPNGKLKNKNESATKFNTKVAFNINSSPTVQDIIERTVPQIKTVPLANPLNPSIIFIE